MLKKIYSRDKRSPSPKHENVSKVMSGNKAKNTRPELTLRKALWHADMKGYRVNWKKAPGRPDIAYPGRKVAIFVHGCFWHHCPLCNTSLPKHNTEFWKTKFAKNVTRDMSKKEALQNLGWSVITVWEHQINSDLKEVIKKISEYLL